MKHSKYMVQTDKANAIEILRRFLADEDGSLSRKALFVLGVLYVASPIDFIPEVFLGPLGFTDDLAVLYSLFMTYQEASSVYKHHKPADPSRE